MTIIGVRCSTSSKTVNKKFLPVKPFAGSFFLRPSRKIRKFLKIPLSSLPFPRSGGRWRAAPDEGKFYPAYKANTGRRRNFHKMSLPRMGNFTPFDFGGTAQANRAACPARIRGCNGIFWLDSVRFPGFCDKSGGNGAQKQDFQRGDSLVWSFA